MVPPPPYAMQFQAEEQVEKKAQEVVSAENEPGMVVPMLLLLPGTFFLLFALILLLFAQDGVLTLSWNARYWFIYMLLSVPLLYVGWRVLGRSSTTEKSL